MDRPILTTPGTSPARISMYIFCLLTFAIFTASWSRRRTGAVSVFVVNDILRILYDARDGPKTTVVLPDRCGLPEKRPRRPVFYLPSMPSPLFRTRKSRPTVGAASVETSRMVERPWRLLVQLLPRYPFQLARLEPERLALLAVLDYRPVVIS
jgi:hypothetical protein